MSVKEVYSLVVLQRKTKSENSGAFIHGVYILLSYWVK
jgi:hypothetical protein